jgi:hypothetical protein
VFKQIDLKLNNLTTSCETIQHSHLYMTWFLYIFFNQKITQLTWICCCLFANIKAQVNEAQMKQILEDYDKDASKLCNENAKANWDVQTDVLNDDKVKIQVNYEY